RHMATFTQASQWVWENVPGDFAMRIDGTDPNIVPLINIALGNSGGQQNDMLSKATRIDLHQKLAYTFVAPADGTVSTIDAPRIGIPNEGDTSAATALHITITPENSDTILTDTVFTSQFANRGDQVGDAYTIPLSQPLQVEFGKRYTFYIEVSVGNPVVIGGSIFARDGGWEEVAPADVCTLPPGITMASDPPSGLLSNEDCDRRAALGSLVLGYDFNNEWEDTPEKRDDLERILDGTDYIIIATNRRYDSESRIPMRWPMTNRYYEALFSGELGFDLVKTFQETFELGPLQVSDQYLPTYTNIPKWLNELEAEEAFSVYDHPVVFIYKKSANYSPDKTREILYSVPLDRAPGNFASGDRYDDPELLGVVTWDVEHADKAPTQLMMTDDMKSIQYNGGTWSQRFDRNSVINQNQVLAVVVWYLALMLFGFAMFPLMFVIAPGLADRGYSVSKFAGVLLVAWLGWLAASGRLAVWSPEGLRFILLLLALVNAVVAWRVREKLIGFIRENWRMLLIIEGITLALFLVFVGVRLTNPDLWTSNFGGEKPMDYAYFNGVLRSTIFPAIDPWYAGGYINYYYFGFVIVAVPTLFTGILPSIAYNLILPMLFSFTGIGAFAVAFSVVSARTERYQPEGAIIPAANSNRRRLGNPYVAGVIALLLAVVLGNLDTPRTFLTGVASQGDYKDIGTLDQFLIDDYRAQTGTDPQGDDLAKIYERAQHPSSSDYIRYELASTSNILTSIGRGLSRIISGERMLSIAPDRWFWGPSRIIAEPNQDLTITEMPIFTYVYADLHGHMIAMPLMLFIVAMVLNELLLAGRERRWFWSRLFGLFMVALPAGLTIANNSWDYPTFTMFCALGLGYGWWLNWRRINRISLLSMVIRMSTFFVLSYFVALPFRTWFAATYSSVKLWDGKQTALWQYFSIHGLFLFLIVSLLVWETASWLRSVRVRELRGKQFLVIGFAVVVGTALLGSVWATLVNYQVALVVVPLVVWIGVLFFRPGQSAPMQFVLVVTGLALALTMGVEIVTLEGDIQRQNTVFKFYIQVWLLFSVAAGAAGAWLFQASERWSRTTRALWYAPLLILFFVAGLYPIMAVRGKAEYRLPPRDVLASLPPSLNGDDFMKYTHDYSFDGEPMPMDMEVDYNIIHWLQDNVQGSPVIIEGISERVLYQWGGRIAIQTGLPSVIGWDWHQKQQRTFDPLPSLVEHRLANANFFYTTSDLEQAWRILRNYDVSYVIVGALENSRYEGSPGLQKFDQMVQRGWLELVYETPSAPLSDGAPRPSGKIYRVNKDAAPDIYIAGLLTVQIGN
ncbi:MAG TPA: DUF2298 domain-containing protein, partial [Phototrophicaceae bacterium]|nr:DUF2298 domain-containing protein [Phototrophicaceae bacterium]